MLESSRMPCLESLVLAVTLVGLPAAAQVPPLGPDFEVGTPDIYECPVVAVNPYGQSLMAWAEHFGPGTIVAYDRDGGYRGAHWLPVALMSERPIHVAPDHGGGFVATWESLVPGGLEAVPLDSAGGMVGTPFVVNSAPSGAEGPRVAVAPSGAIVVVWSDYSSDGDDDSGTSIQARLFAPDGAPYIDRFQVNVTTTGDQRHPSLAVGSEWFMVVWESESSAGNDQSGLSIQARGFTLDGSQASEELQVNTHTPADQTYPDIALGADGAYVVTWDSETSSGDDSSSTSIQARRYLPSGAPAGDDFQVNTYTAGAQLLPAIGVMDGGAFEVVWSSYGSPADPDHWSIQRQAFTSDGGPSGGQGQVNTTVVYTQGGAPGLSMSRHGDFVATWGVDGFHIRARIFRNTLFIDGFESGDTSLWSVSVPY